MKNMDLSLYLVTDRSFLQGRTLEEVVCEAVEGGVSIVQLREKEASSREFYELAVGLKRVLSPYKVPLIINDRLDIALAVDAEGLHIGNSDLPYEITRALLGPKKIIGLSVESIEDAIHANSLNVDYIAVSPVFDTPTKTDTAHALGLDGVQTISRTSRHPCIGIGGINLENVGKVIEANAQGVAIVSAIMAAPSPKLAAKEFKAKILSSKAKQRS